MRNVLVVGAHPDDEVLGCGALMYQLREQARFHVWITNVYRTPGGAMGRRLTGLQRSSEILGFELLGVGDLPHLHNGEHVDVLASTVGRVIVERGIDFVITHWRGDRNQDHVACYDGVQIATRPMEGESPISWACMEVLSSTDEGLLLPFQPNVWIEIGEEALAAQVEALKAYSTEVQRDYRLRSERGLRLLAEFRGGQMGCRYASALTLVRWTETL